MVCTRPDISYVVSIVSMYMHDPRKGHWQAMKWILLYLQNTVDVGLTFEKDRSFDKCIVGYCDFDYVGDLDKQWSTICWETSSTKACIAYWEIRYSIVAIRKLATSGHIVKTI